MSAPGLVEAAARIGDALAAQAYRSGDRSTWLAVDPTKPAAGLHVLPGELYAGTAGIALFLGALASTTGVASYGELARSALRQALQHWKGPERGREAFGLFDGWGGVALAALTVGQSLGDAEIVEAGRDGLRRAAGIPFDDPRAYDLISGRSGAILALVEAHRRLGDESLVHRAVELATQLVGSAVERGDTASWEVGRTYDLPVSAPLTGLSHGASGPGLALLALAAVTGEDSQRALAGRAFAYEAELFDPARGNWPDMIGKGGGSFTTTWCYGAPGIGVARVAAARLDRPHRGDWLDDVRRALPTTLAALRASHDDAAADASLCHGTAGLLACAHDMAVALHDEGALAEVRAVATAMADGITTGRGPLALAVLEGSDPTLMTGAAGVGYALLRLGADLAPSPLLVM